MLFDIMMRVGESKNVSWHAAETSHDTNHAVVL